MKGAEEHEDSVHSRVRLSLAKDTVQIPWTATQKNMESMPQPAKPCMI